MESSTPNQSALDDLKGSANVATDFEAHGGVRSVVSLADRHDADPPYAGAATLAPLHGETKSLAECYCRADEVAVVVNSPSKCRSRPPGRGSVAFTSDGAFRIARS